MGNFGKPLEDKSEQDRIGTGLMKEEERTLTYFLGGRPKSSRKTWTLYWGSGSKGTLKGGLGWTEGDESTENYLNLGHVKKAKVWIRTPWRRCRRFGAQDTTALLEQRLKVPTQEPKKPGRKD